MTIFDMACMTSNTTGTGNTITLVAAVAGFQTFLAAGVANTQVISYGISDTANTWEVGSNATFISNSTGQFLIFSGTTRTPAYSSNSGGPINLSGNAVVYQTMLQNDYDTFTPGNTITIGNTTANLFANSTEIALSNSTSQTISTPTSIVVSNGTITVGNPSYNVYINTISVSIGNSTVNNYMDNSSIYIQNSTFTNYITGNFIELGNSTVNVSILYSLIKVNDGTTGNVSLTSSYLQIQDSSYTSFINTSSFIVGNSTANLLANSTEIVLANSTAQTVITPVSFAIGNSTANTSGNSIIESITNSTAQTTFIPGGITLSGAGSNTSLKIGTSSIVANGYSWLPNGLLIQWGNIASNNTGQIVTFPVPFPTACFGITTGANTIAPTKVLGVTLVNATAFTISTANAAATLAYWHATGH